MAGSASSSPTTNEFKGTIWSCFDVFAAVFQYHDPSVPITIAGELLSVIFEIFRPQDIKRFFRVVIFSAYCFILRLGSCSMNSMLYKYNYLVDLPLFVTLVSSSFMISINLVSTIHLTRHASPTAFVETSFLNYKS